MHLHDDPIDAVVLRGGGERFFQPACLRTVAVAMDIERSTGFDRRIPGAGGGLQRRRARDERAAVLVDNIVGRERNEQRRADLEAVPPAGEGRTVLRERVSSEVGLESLRAVVEFNLVIAWTGHPGT